MPRRPDRSAAAAATALVLATAIVMALVAGCTGRARHPAGPGRTGTAAPATAGTGPAPAGTIPLPAGTAPRGSFGVGTRTLSVQRAGRALPTTIWYPATRAVPAAAPAPGRFPVVLFSHGLGGQPTDYTALLSRWAAAGFVVAAPAYPHTSRGTTQLDVFDVLDQPADASAVLTAVLSDPPLRDHLDQRRVCAAGHSAGGITTVGLFTTARDQRLSCGIVLAGDSLGFGTGFAGPGARLLFVHGDRDTVISYQSGRSTYAALTWPKAFLTLPGLGHTAPYVDPRAAGFARVAAVTLDFLRYSLYGDADAGHRLAGTPDLEDLLG